MDDRCQIFYGGSLSTFRSYHLKLNNRSLLCLEVQGPSFFVKLAEPFQRQLNLRLMQLVVFHKFDLVTNSLFKFVSIFEKAVDSYIAAIALLKYSSCNNIDKMDPRLVLNY